MSTITLELAGELTRRRFLGGITAGMLLGACADRSGEPRTPRPTTTAYPRTIETGLGPVTIASDPERIVTLGVEADAVVALGRTPVAIAGGFPDPTQLDPWLRGHIDPEQVDLLNLANDLPFERIAGYRPDLILAGTYFGIDEQYERLSAIAPTVTYVRGSYVDTWQEQTLLIGQALAAEENARTAVDDLDARIQSLRPDFEDRTCSLSFYFYYEPGAIAVVANPKDYSAVFFRSLGLELPPALTALADPEATDSAIIGLEQLPLLDADLVIMTHASPELRQEIEANPLFNNLSAVTDGRYVPVEVSVVTAIRSPSVLRVGYALDELVPDFAKALT
ncbi:MAG: iron-siderophore ABC transporter substrate-binding protein [Egibacteraceae bacterium]